MFTSVPGSIIFRPLEAKFNLDKDSIGKMDPYCKFKVGWHRARSSVATSQGIHPTWTDVISLPRKHDEKYAKIKVKDKDKGLLRDRLGDAKINLEEVIVKGRVVQWIPLYKKTEVVGEILLDIEYVGHK